MAYIGVINEKKGGRYFPDAKFLSGDAQFKIRADEQVIIAYSEVRPVHFEKISPLMLIPRVAAQIDNVAHNNVYAYGVEIRNMFLSHATEKSYQAVSVLLDEIVETVDADVIYMYVSKTDVLSDVLLAYGFEKSSQVLVDNPDKTLLYFNTRGSARHARNSHREISPPVAVKRPAGVEKRQKCVPLEKKPRRMLDGDLSYEMDSDEERAEINKLTKQQVKDIPVVEKKKDWFLPDILKQTEMMEEEEEEEEEEGERVEMVGQTETLSMNGMERERKYTNVKLQARFFGHFERTGDAILTRPGDEKWKNMVEGDYIMFNTPDGKTAPGIITSVNKYTSAEQMIAEVCADRINANLNMDPVSTLKNFMGIFECEAKVNQHGCFAFHVKKKEMPADTKHYMITNVKKQNYVDRNREFGSRRFY